MGQTPAVSIFGRPDNDYTSAKTQRIPEPRTLAVSNARQSSSGSLLEIEVLAGSPACIVTGQAALANLWPHRIDRARCRHTDLAFKSRTASEAEMIPASTTCLLRARSESPTLDHRVL